MILKLIFFLDKTFGTGKDTTATILVTIFTFSAGILITLALKAVEKYLNRRNYRKLARINTLNLIKEIHRQSVEYKNFSENIKVETSIPSFKRRSISSIGVFQQLGYKDLYISFFNGIENIQFKGQNKRRIAFNNLWSTLEFLTAFHKKTFDDVRNFIESEKEANELRNHSLTEVYKIINTIRFTLHLEKVPKNLAAYCDKLEDILKKHLKQKDYTRPNIVNEYLILPISELNETNLDLMKQYLNILSPVAFGSALSECMLRYENQKNLIEQNSKYFAHLNEAFLDSFKKLKFTYKTLF